MAVLKPTQPARLLARVTLEIHDLGCGGGGSLTIERALANVPGVTRVSVNPATEMAYVEFRPDVCSAESLIRAVADRGFRASRFAGY